MGLLPRIAAAVLLAVERPTNRVRRVAASWLAALVLMVASPANAFPIQYSLSGTGSGTIGTASFTDAAFEFSFISDTTDRTTFTSDTFFNVARAAIVSISGLGSFSLTEQSRVFVNNGNDAVGFGETGRGDYFGVFDLPSLASMEYDLISVYPRETGRASHAPEKTLRTNGGLLVMAVGSSGSFEAIVE